MATRRRPPSRRRPLREFAQRSPLHGLAVWLLQQALHAVILLALYLFIVDVAVPNMVDGFIEIMTDTSARPTATAPPQ